MSENSYIMHLTDVSFYFIIVTSLYSSYRKETE